MCLDARLHARWTFIECAGARAGAAVRGAAWGVDRSEVVAKAPQREVTCQDSFRACEGTAAARLALAALAPDLVRRMDEEFHEHERVARRRFSSRGGAKNASVAKRTARAKTSVSLPMPPFGDGRAPGNGDARGRRRLGGGWRAGERAPEDVQLDASRRRRDVVFHKRRNLRCLVFFFRFARRNGALFFLRERLHHAPRSFRGRPSRSFARAEDGAEDGARRTATGRVEARDARDGSRGYASFVFPRRVHGGRG